ncbi:MAG TPA: HD domain-containing protein [Dehalococcoidia bacterium]|nr:HD domain-containing protein [Dehalococcoidia bacterium]
MRYDPPAALAPLLARIDAAAAEAAVRAWAVGGTVRDALLARPMRDLDLAVEGDARRFARALAAALGGQYFELHEEHDVARIALPAATAGVALIDVAGVAAGMEADLRRRDFTVDAMAAPIAGGEVLDPCGGLGDLRRHTVAMTAPAALDADPLRLLRAVRLAAELGFDVAPETAGAIRERAPRVLDAAPERRRDELMRIFALAAAAPPLRLLDALALLDVLLPEVAAGKGVAQPREHAYDVFEHNVRTVAALDAMLYGAASDALPAWVADDVRATFAWREQHLRDYFAGEVGAEHARAALLRLAGLLHDVAKPQTRARQPDGRVRFFGHAELGAEMTAKLMRRYRFSERETRWVALLVEEHLRPGQLAAVGEAPTRRALARFFRDLGDAAEALLFLSLADAAAARGPRLQRTAWRANVRYMNSLVVRSVEDAGIVHPLRLLTGRDIMSAFGLPEGPRIGRLLAAVEDAQGAGDVRDRDEALALVRRLLQAEGAAGGPEAGQRARRG